MATNEASRDLAKKLVLEGQIRKSFQAINAKIAKDYAKATGGGINPENYRDTIEETLLIHYNNVAAKFGNRISAGLPQEIQITTEEEETIADALQFFFLARAIESAKLITRTNQADISLANNHGNLERELAAEEDPPRSMTAQEVASIGGKELSRKLKSRLDTIVAPETQMAAEIAKLTEAEVLTGNVPSARATTGTSTPVTKEWVSVGDEDVREAHDIANTQTVGIMGVFRVGGQFMRYPGDTSLGATAGNTDNCRCSVVYNVDQIAQTRRSR